MSKSFEYRDKAAKCQAMADQCKDDWSKAVWLETAETWLRLGAQFDQTIERKSPQKLAPRPGKVEARVHALHESGKQK